jgi:hypothetical protein
MSQKQIKTTSQFEGTYGIIKQTKTASIVKKIYKHDALYFTTIKEIAIYRAICAKGHSDLFVKIYKIKPNKIYMEKYEGNLNNVNFKHMTMCDKLKIIGSLINAMSALHNMMIIHGDIKPANILINTPDDVKIIDFGLANLGYYSPSVCISQCHEIYTWYWRAPEIHSKARYTNKADIWAMGLVFLRIIIFVAEDSFVCIMNKLFAQIKSLTRQEQLTATKNILKGLFIRPDNPERFAQLHECPALFDIIVHMLIPNPEWRYDIKTIREKFALIEHMPMLVPVIFVPDILEFKYSDRQERLFELQKIYHIGQDNNLSYQIIMHSFVLYDMIYCKDPEFHQVGIEFSCIYISCALYYCHGNNIFGGGILEKEGIIKILQLLDYNIYTSYIIMPTTLTEIMQLIKDYIYKRKILNDDGDQNNKLL